jgi:hypothetical protein
MLHASRVTTWSQHSRNTVATCGGGERKTPDVWMLHVTSFATCSEHVRNTLATSFVECCKDDNSQHGKSSSQHCKSCLQHLLASQRDRRLISSLHPNRRLRIRPMLAPGSDVRALAVPLIFYVLCTMFATPPYPLARLHAQPTQHFCSILASRTRATIPNFP